MLLATFVLTVLVDLTVAIEVGMVLSAFLFMRRMAEVTAVKAVTQPARPRRASDYADVPLAQLTLAASIPAGVEVFEIQRRVLLRRRGGVQGDTHRGRPEAKGADHPHARRVAARRRRGFAHCGRRSTQPVGAHPRADRRDPRAADGGAGTVTVYEELGEGQIYMTLEDALDRAREHITTRNRRRSRRSQLRSGNQLEVGRQTPYSETTGITSAGSADFTATRGDAESDGESKRQRGPYSHDGRNAATSAPTGKAPIPAMIGAKG